MCNEIISTRTKKTLGNASHDVYNTEAEDMLKQILIAALVSALLAVNVGAHEPGGFNGKLYAAEVAVGGSMALTPILLGVAGWTSAPMSGEDTWKTALSIMSLYPFAMGGGTFLVGEIWGAPSKNKATAYFVPTVISLSIMGLSAYIGSKHTFHPEEGAMLGELISAVPNAFLTAYLYNVVKKPKDENAGASISISPYLTASRERNAESGFTITCGIVASY